MAVDDEHLVTEPALGWAAKLTPTPSRLPLAGHVMLRTLIQRVMVVGDVVSLAYAVLSPGGVASRGSGPAVAVGLLASALCLWGVVARTGRRLLLLRLLAALGGTMLLASLASPGHSVMVVYGVAAVVEVSLVRGPWAFLLPVAWWTTAALSGLGAPMYGTAVVVLLNWLLGWGLAIYLMLRERTQRRDLALLVAGRTAEARLAARSDVLQRSGETADLIQRVGVLLSLHGSQRLFA